MWTELFLAFWPGSSTMWKELKSSCKTPSKTQVEASHVVQGGKVLAAKPHSLGSVLEPTR